MLFLPQSNLKRDIPIGPYSVYQDHPKRRRPDSFSDLLDQLPDPPNENLGRHRDSFDDLLDQFPVPPTYIPVPPTHIPALPTHVSRPAPVIKENVVLVEKTTFVPAENCPSPAISEESTIDSSSESNNNLSTNPSISISISISISNETANTSVHETESLPCTSAIFQVLSSGIDVKNKNIARFTLIHNPEKVLPATGISGCIQSQSLCAFPALPEAELQYLHDKYSLRPIHNPEDSSHQCLDNASTRVPVQVVPEAELQYLHDKYSLMPIHNPEDSSHQCLDNASIRAPIQVVPALPTKYERPFVAPLRIVKKNEVPNRPIVAPLEPPVVRRRLSGNWEQAIDRVIQAFRDAEAEDRDFRDLFSGDGDDSFVSQSSVFNVSGDNEGHLDGGNGDCEDYGRQMEDSFYSMEDLSMVMATPPDLITLKVEDASVSLSSELAVAQEMIMEVKDKLNDVDPPGLRICECEGCEEEEDYSWIAVTDDGDDSHSQEDDQWSDRLELDEYVSS